MPRSAWTAGVDDPGIDEALGWYYDALAGGQPVERSDLFRRFPALRGGLEEFFADEDRLARLTDSVCEPSTFPATVGPVRPPEGRGHDRLGDYEVLEEIGRGGMGVVHKARQVSANRLVALKMILPGRLTTKEDEDRFVREAEATAGLDHPNIVPIYDVGRADGQRCFSMKLIEGGSLAKRLPEFTANQRAAARLLSRVARAVHHAHQRGILHRDVKPANVLLAGAPGGVATVDHRPGVEAEWQPYVTDFGLARRLGPGEGLTLSGTIVGTPEYMSPEQASAQKVLTTATDVYSLGAVLYALLTGQPPFRGASLLETLEMVARREPTPPRALNAGVDRDLETVCLKCLRKAPEQRYTSAEALADDLDRWLAGEPISARPVGRRERAWRWCKRNRVVASLAGLAAVLTVALIVGLSVGWWWTSRLRAAEEAAAGVARSQSAKAQRREKQALAALDAVADAAYTWLDDPKLAPAKRDVLKNTIDLYEDILKDRPDDPNMRHRAAQAHFRLATVTRPPDLAPEVRRRDLEAIDRHFERAQELWEALVAQFPREAKYRGDLFVTYTYRAWSWPPERRGDRLALLRKAHSVAERLVADFPGDPHNGDRLAFACQFLGHELAPQAPAEAEQVYKQGIAVAVALSRAHRDRPMFLRHAATNAGKLGMLYVANDRPDEAEKALTQAVGVARALVRSKPKDVAYRWELADITRDLALFQFSRGQEDKAVKALQDAAGLFRELVKDAPHHDFRTRLAGATRNLAEVLARSGRTEDADRAMEECVRVFGDQMKRDALAQDAASQLCWVLATGPVPGRRDAARALELARGLKRGGRDVAMLEGAALLEMGERDLAEVELEKATRAKGWEGHFSRLLLARLMQAEGNKAGARRAYRQALARPMNAHEALYFPERHRLREETARALGLPVPGKSKP